MMKLSEAIRNGAQKNPQAFLFFVAEGYGEELCTCALTAAGVATGLEETHPLQEILSVRDDTAADWVLHFVSEKFNIPLGESPTIKCTVTNCRDIEAMIGVIDVFRLVIHLNDIHSWTREEIADYLEKEGY